MQKKIDKLLSELNQSQYEAVTSPNGPVLVLAGAGSGKTRVLTSRVVYLLTATKVPPVKILVLTFTNKAAEEMKNRIIKHIESKRFGLWMGTFHSIFARILRIDGKNIGIGKNFIIYDKNDQLKQIKNILKEKKYAQSEVSPGKVLHNINRLKNKLVLPESFENIAKGPFKELICEIYKIYQLKLKQNDALDFDDLLIKPIELFNEYPEILKKYQKRFQHILVDEFQDTNRAQYTLLKMLSALHKNIFVVGDDDQSIYRWRGAEISNILDFKIDFPNTKIYRLEQNYRSTKNILNAAYSVIKNNSNRMSKKLWSDNNTGNRVKLINADSDIEEASIVASIIKEQISKDKLSWKNFAVLYRTNSQSRVLEKELLDSGIPYNIIGGTRFYERKEIKDLIAYLNLLVNKKDNISFLRIVNYPPRGIGKVTLNHFTKFAEDNQLSLFQAIKKVDLISQISSRGKKNLKNFYNFMNKYKKMRKTLSLTELIRSLIDELKIKVILKEEGTTESLNRLENIQEFLNSVSEYAKNTEKPKLEEFLHEISLYTDIDEWPDKTEAISLMTLHAAKGLEFPVVIITGAEEGLFPLIKESFESQAEDLEEERRLFYVGATRAKKDLYISFAKSRYKYGEHCFSVQSRFINELDDRYIQIYNKPAPVKRKLGKDKQTLMQKEETDDNYKSLKVGRTVIHPKFGRGIVLKKEGTNDNVKLIVKFEDGKKKKLVQKYANLIVEY